MTVPTKMPPWSYSGLTSFETCPKRYYHIKVAKDVIETPGEAATWGSTVHTHIENRLLTAKQLPDAIAHYEPLVAPLCSTPGTLIVEHQLAVTESLTSSEWMGTDTWCRGIIDVGVISRSGKSAVLLDWKTGKRKSDIDQLKLFAGLAFANMPDLERVQTGFVWLKDGVIDKQNYDRSQVSMIWNAFVPRVQRMKRAYENTTFHPKPSGLCAKWCPVPKSKCEFSGKQ